MMFVSSAILPGALRPGLSSAWVGGKAPTAALMIWKK